jgi:hypothetical protein
LEFRRLCKIDDFFLESNKTTNAAGKNDTRSIGIYIFFRDAGISNGFITDYKSELSKTVDLTRFFLSRYATGSKPFTSQAKRVLNFAASNREIKSAPDFPASKPVQ